MFALIDCNNFFVSCERVFRPDLEGKPVVVLSSNDGCAVARSNEVKRLGVPMGAPAFKFRQLFERHNVVQFSANFELYGNIARRIVDILTEVTPRTEVYSIDESFLDVSQLPIKDFTAWGKQIRGRVLRETGIPVSIGIAPTKTLAKLASEVAKTHEEHGGVLTLNPNDLQPYLEPFPIQEIWGIGWRLAPRLKAEGISNAWQLATARPQYMQQLMGIHGRQLVAELNGTSCYSLAPLKNPQKSIMRGRTFGEDTGESHVIEAAIATLASQAAFRLRRGGQATRRAGILIETNRHKPGYKRWYREVRFASPISDTGQVITALCQLFFELHRGHPQYHRVNIFLHDFASASALQADLLGLVNIAAHERSSARMAAIDAINNRYGRRHIYYAAENLGTSWQPKRKLISPKYVSAWDELPVARIAI